VAYPRALGSLDVVQTKFEELVTTLNTFLNEMTARLLERSAAARAIGNDRGVATGIALALLEKVWGHPARHYGMREGQFLVNGQSGSDCPPELEADLDALVAGAAHGRLPPSVLRARKALAEAVENAWARLWSVVELGIDGE
jgi:hypothetical protein